VPELPEVQAHAERLDAAYAGTRLARFQPITFTALKTATPAPDLAYGLPLERVGRRAAGTWLVFEPVTFVVHLMQGGRLREDEKQSAKPRGGQARFRFEDGRALLLTEQGTERRAGVWCVPSASALDDPPLDKLGPEADQVTPEEMAALFSIKATRLHSFLRDQRCIAGLGRRLANEVCHRAKLSPFASTKKLGLPAATDVVAAIHDAVEEGLAYDRRQPDMSASDDRPSRVHHRVGEPCPECGDTIRAVEYSSYTVNYCPTCQTGGKLLADNTTSRFLK